MAATLSFTLQPLRSLLASKRAAKEAASSALASDQPVTAIDAKTGAQELSASTKPNRERINVHSTSRAELPSGTALVSEQARLAARARIDV